MSWLSALSTGDALSSTTALSSTPAESVGAVQESSSSIGTTIEDRVPDAKSVNLWEPYMSFRPSPAIQRWDEVLEKGWAGLLPGWTLSL